MEARRDRTAPTDAERRRRPGSELVSSARRIAFTRHRGRTAEIFVTRADAAARRRLTHRRGADDSPAWSSTGWIAYVRRLAEGGELRLVRPDGAPNRPIVRSTGPWDPPSGRLTARGSFEVWDGVDSELYRISANGTSLEAADPDDVADFEQSGRPPGADRDALLRRSNDVWTMRPDGSGKRRLITRPPTRPWATGARAQDRRSAEWAVQDRTCDLGIKSPLLYQLS